jgi:hypothetical protein
MVWKMTAKYGIPYFSNFVNSDMAPEDARSMCCRLVTNPLHGVIKITYPNGDGETLLEDYTGFVELQTLIRNFAVDQRNMLIDQIDKKIK